MKADRINICDPGCLLHRPDLVAAPIFATMLVQKQKVVSLFSRALSAKKVDPFVRQMNPARCARLGVGKMERSGCKIHVPHPDLVDLGPAAACEESRLDQGAKMSR